MKSATVLTTSMGPACREPRMADHDPVATDDVLTAAPATGAGIATVVTVT